MARMKVTLANGNIAAWLRDGRFAGVIHARAEAVQEAAQADMPTDDADGAPFPTRIDDYVTDRTVSAVVIDHPAGHRVEARHGVLIRAAAASGLEVKRAGDG